MRRPQTWLESDAMNAQPLLEAGSYEQTLLRIARSLPTYQRAQLLDVAVLLEKRRISVSTELPIDDFGPSEDRLWGRWLRAHSPRTGIHRRRTRHGRICKGDVVVAPLDFSDFSDYKKSPRTRRCDARWP